DWYKKAQSHIESLTGPDRDNDKLSDGARQLASDLRFWGDSDLYSRTKDSAIKTADGWMDKLKSGKVSEDELGSMRKDAARVTSFLDATSSDGAKYRALRALSVSDPSFLPKENQTGAPNKDKLVDGLLTSGTRDRVFNDSARAGLSAY